jgi:hypothetical protein
MASGDRGNTEKKRGRVETLHRQAGMGVLIGQRLFFCLLDGVHQRIPSLPGRRPTFKHPYKPNLLH